MQKWEVCYIITAIIKSALIGKSTYALQAVQCTPDGKRPIIAQSSGYVDGDLQEQDAQLDKLIAQLGLDGWEPIPVGHLCH